ncbi:putative membrane protein [[Clostridium] sordellii ATCC 9714]|nr:putative membrane protein [[Clostridium] sordellii ATCC 9714] [Paeniclostridium sordellii ATCC 9714]
MVISFYNSREDYIKHLNYSNILISKVLSILFVLFYFLNP